MNGKLWENWEEVIVLYYKVLSWQIPGELAKIIENICHDIHFFAGIEPAYY
jgi:hypothetical protein